MVVCGIDPGLSVSAVVRIRDRGVVRADVIRAKPPRGGFDALTRASVSMADRIWQCVAAGPTPDLIAIEGWENQGVARAAGADRYHVPVLLGAIAALDPHEVEVTWQRASVVLGPRGYGWLMKASVRPAIRGWVQQITNEHLRSAACHALHAASVASQEKLAV